MNKTKPCFRKCVGSNKMFLKEKLIRIVKTTAKSVKIDLTGKENGRGVYISADLSILQHARKTKAIERAVKTKLDETFYESLTSAIINFQEGLKK